MTTWLSIDFETRSTIDLPRRGIYVYAPHPTTDVWCMSYAINDGPIKRWAMGDYFPADLEELFEAEADHACVDLMVRAWNAQFERLIWKHVMTARRGWPIIPLDRWVCTAALAARCSLPRKLDDACRALGLPVQKDMEGHRLMMQMAKPRRIEPNGTIVWWDDMPRRQRLGAYCDVDVDCERQIFAVLPPTGEGNQERRVWLLDQAMNDRGVMLDRPLAEVGLSLTKRVMNQLHADIKALTNGRVPDLNKVDRLKQWLHDEHNLPIVSLAKIPLQRMLTSAELSAPIREALELRRDGGKSSTKKFASMLGWANDQDILCGMLLYHGAGTGRWSGKGPQPQNYIKGKHKVTATLVADIMRNDPEWLSLFYGSPLDAITSVLRGCFIARPGHEFSSADFSAVEARLVAWLFDSTKLVNLFARKGKVYEEMAAVIYGKTVDEIIALGEDSMERFIGKNTVLGCGFQMGASTFVRQLRQKFGISVPDELGERAVKAYRSDNAEIPAGWKSMNRTAIAVVKERRAHWTAVPATRDRIHFRMWDTWLQMRLPSGRSLWYPEARVAERLAPWKNDDGEDVYTDAVHFMGVPPGKARLWVEMTLYGGLLTENAVQAIARDLMVDAMFRLDAAGYPPLFTVHDEVIAEHPIGYGSLDEYKEIVTLLPAWAAGCPIAASGWRGPRYRK